MSTNPGYIAVESAAKIAGIPARTLRYWIGTGKLPATGGKRGRLVRLADVEMLAAMTGRTNGNGSLPADSATAMTGNVAERSDLSAIERQLAEYREMIERLHAENVSLAGQLGKALGQLEEARAAIRQLPPARSFGMERPQNGQDWAFQPVTSGSIDPQVGDPAPDPADPARECPESASEPQPAPIAAATGNQPSRWRRWLSWL